MSVPELTWTTEPAGEQRDRRGIEQCGGRRDSRREVAGEAAIAAQPRDGLFHGPAPGLDGKADLTDLLAAVRGQRRVATPKRPRCAACRADTSPTICSLFKEEPLLLTPGPCSLSRTVKEAMLHDYASGEEVMVEKVKHRTDDG